MAFSFLPKEDEYFTLFSTMAARIREAARLLVEMTSGDQADFVARFKKIKDIEHECDNITHTLTTKLNKSFITPFDREDIYTLSVALDDVCDYIDAAARAIVMYDIREIAPPIKQTAELIEKLSVEIEICCGMLNNGKGLGPHLQEIQRLENEADDVYFKAIGDLFHNDGDPIRVIKLKEVFEILEYATDRCESVGNIIESVILKHS